MEHVHSILGGQECLCNSVQASFNCGRESERHRHPVEHRRRPHEWEADGVRRLGGFEAGHLRHASTSRVSQPCWSSCTSRLPPPAWSSRYRPADRLHLGGEGVAGEDGGEGATRQGREGVTEGFGSGEKQLLGGGGEGGTNVRMLY